MLSILNHISPFQPIPTPDFESIVKIQVCHFVDNNFRIMMDEIMVTLNFHVINHIKIDDTSCCITIYLSFVFILPEAEYPWFETYLGVGQGSVNHCIFLHKGK